MTGQEQQLLRQLIERFNRLERRVGLLDTQEVATGTWTVFAGTLLDDTDAAEARTTLGVVAGGAGDIWVEKAGDTMTGNLAVASVAVTGNALRVIRNLAAANTDDAVVEIIQTNISDDQPALEVTQEGGGAIATFYDGVTAVLRINDGGRLDVYNIIRALTSGGLRLEDDAGNPGIVVEGGGFVGIGGVTNPTAPLEISGDNSGVQVVIYPSGTNTRAMVRAIPKGAPTSANGRAIMQFFNTDFVADSANYEYAQFGMISDTFEVLSRGVGTGTTRPINICTYNNTNQLYLATNGRVGVGAGTSPAGKLHADQASTTAGIPVLVLDQADLSEQMIDFITTVGAGNPVDTAAVGTYYGKVRVSVNGTFKYIPLYNS